MKRKIMFIAGFVITLLASAVAQSSAQKSFDLMKSLSGEWEGKTTSGNPVSVTYRITGNGSAVLGEINAMNADRHEDMISMFHLDGDRLLLTHYCAMGNQPRMKASIAADGKSITFDFIDATNLASPEDGHMQQVVISLPDPQHHTEEWHFVDHGKVKVERFELERKS